MVNRMNAQAVYTVYPLIFFFFFFNLTILPKKKEAGTSESSRLNQFRQLCNINRHRQSLMFREATATVTASRQPEPEPATVH